MISAEQTAVTLGLLSRKSFQILSLSLDVPPALPAQARPLFGIYIPTYDLRFELT